ncbi:unnamed protein product [Closterium sp. Naga37s-1]|nr:unnamed protein product [Closterium sp. Naga37s-1]
MRAASAAEGRAEEGGTVEWSRAWYAVGVTADMDATRPHAITIVGRPLVLWRDAAGSWRCFLDQCPHRLVPLSEVRPASASHHTSVPITPVPITPVPIAPVPIAPVPIAPVPIAPVPIAPVPIAPVPIAPVPIAPVPIAPVPIAPVPIAPVPIAPVPIAPVPIAPVPIAPVPIAPVPIAPVPIAPVPIAPVPIAPVPIAPVPIAPVPIAPVPIAPVPIAPVPIAPVPIAPVPIAPVPIAPVPIAPVPIAPVPIAPVPIAPVPIAPVRIAPVRIAPVPIAPVPIAPIPIAPVPTAPIPTTPVPIAPTSILSLSQPPPSPLPPCPTATGAHRLIRAVGVFVPRVGVPLYPLGQNGGVIGAADAHHMYSHHLFPAHPPPLTPPPPNGTATGPHRRGGAAGVFVPRVGVCRQRRVRAHPAGRPGAPRPAPPRRVLPARMRHCLPREGVPHGKEKGKAGGCSAARLACACPQSKWVRGEGRRGSGERQLCLPSPPNAHRGASACPSLLNSPPSQSPPLSPLRARYSPSLAPTSPRPPQGVLFVWPNEHSAEQAEATPLPLPHGVEWDEYEVLPHYTRRLAYGYEVLVENVVDLSHFPFAHHGVGMTTRDKGGPINNIGMTQSGVKGFEGPIHVFGFPTYLRFQAPQLVFYHSTPAAPQVLLPAEEGWGSSSKHELGDF